ncbi:hypothetical protein BGW39_007107 [Mortierella sp. 14UC]|nr:hypothetical protein BGW39_007107 [Mortierella sp. 14UC]
MSDQLPNRRILRSQHQRQGQKQQHTVHFDDDNGEKAQGCGVSDRKNFVVKLRKVKRSVQVESAPEHDDNSRRDEGH